MPIIMKHNFTNPTVPPLTPEQLRSVGIHPDNLWFSPTFLCWQFAGLIAVQHPYKTTGQIIKLFGLTPNPDA